VESGRFIIAVLKNTPWWTWVLLAYLIYQGVRAMRGGPTSLMGLSIIPIALLVWGLWVVVDRFHGNGPSLIVWVICFALGLSFGILRTASLSIHVDKERNTIELPGSSMALVSALLVFGIKYALAVLSAVRPDTVATLWFLIVDVGTTGLIAGVFAGRLFSLWRKYKSAAPRGAATI
jgi:hypothetical protein